MWLKPKDWGQESKAISLKTCTQKHKPLAKLISALWDTVSKTKCWLAVVALSCKSCFHDSCCTCMHAATVLQDPCRSCVYGFQRRWLSTWLSKTLAMSNIWHSKTWLSKTLGNISNTWASSRAALSECLMAEITAPANIWKQLQFWMCHADLGNGHCRGQRYPSVALTRRLL